MIEMSEEKETLLDGGDKGRETLHIPSSHKVAAKQMSVGREETANKSLRTAVLVWLAFQNAAHTLLIRYSRAREVDEMFRPSVAVFVTEIMKVVICAAVVLCQEGPSRFFSVLRTYTIAQPWDTLKVCVPAMVYVVQNNLNYIAASHLEAATFMITSQLKIFTTAVFSIFILGRSLSSTQWCALFLLFFGVSLVQLQATDVPSSDTSQNPLIGMMCIVVACLLSGFAGVYFEKILKGSVSLCIRNVQLAIFAIPSSLISVYAQDGDFVNANGFLYGFDSVVWIVSLWYGIGGLSVAVCIKYADNIAKNFATSVAIILATLGSMFLFSFQPSLGFLAGASFVILSIFMYSSNVPFINHMPRNFKYNFCV